MLLPEPVAMSTKVSLPAMAASITCVAAMRAGCDYNSNTPVICTREVVIKCMIHFVPVFLAIISFEEKKPHSE